MTTEIQQDIAGLAEAGAAMVSGSAHNVSQLLNVPVEFSLVEIGGGEQQIAEVIEDGVHLTVEFDGAVRGASWLALSTADAETIVKMMTQGMEIDEDDLLGELGLSALSEAMNQLMAGAATALSDGLGERINISPPSISTNPEPAPDYEAVVLIYEGAIAEQATSRVFWRIERELAEDLGARWLAAHDTQRAAEPAAPVATAPPSAASPAVPGGGVINSVELDIAVELGNVAMTIGDLLRMGHGSVVTLSQSVGDKVVMLANGTPVASGEVVIVDGTLGFRVADLITAPRGE